MLSRSGSRPETPKLNTSQSHARLPKTGSSLNLCELLEDSIGEETEAAQAPAAPRERSLPAFSASSAFSACAAPQSKSAKTNVSPKTHPSSVALASGASGEGREGSQDKQSRIAEMRRKAIEGKCDNPRCKKVEEEDHKFDCRCHKCSRVKYCSKVLHSDVTSSAHRTRRASS